MKKRKIKISNGIMRLLAVPEMSIVIPLIFLCIYTGFVKPAFFDAKNIQIILRYCAFVGALAVGEAFVMMTGEADLSIGANSAFTAVIFGTLAINMQWNAFFAVTAAILAGAFVGFLNGLLSFKLGMSSWIVTLSTQYICKGLATVLSKGQAICSLTGGYEVMKQARPLGLSWMLIIVIIIYIVAEIIIRYTKYGRMIHGTGLNVEGCYIAGINTTCVKWLCMIFAGAMAGLCGVLQSINTLTASPTTGIGNEFSAVICCVIGGVSISGGKGSLLGVAFGVLMFQTLKNCLQLLGLDTNVQLVVTGIVLMMAVMIDIFGVTKKYQRTEQ